MIANIGPRGQAQRRRFGIIALGAAAVLVIFLMVLGAPPAWRLLALPPLWLSALGFFQARDKT